MEEALEEAVLAADPLEAVVLAAEEAVEVVLAALLAVVSVEALEAEPEPATLTETHPANARTAIAAIAVTTIAFVNDLIFVSFPVFCSVMVRL